MNGHRRGKHALGAAGEMLVAVGIFPFAIVLAIIGVTLLPIPDGVVMLASIPLAIYLVMLVWVTRVKRGET